MGLVSAVVVVHALGAHVASEVVVHIPCLDIVHRISFLDIDLHSSLVASYLIEENKIKAYMLHFVRVTFQMIDTIEHSATNNT